MERLTSRWPCGMANFPAGKLPEVIDRLAAIEDILGDSYDLNRLRELTDVNTCNLVEELKKREGVDVHVVENRSDMFVMAEGPAVVLVITD